MEVTPEISSDGSTLYFAAHNRSGGIGYFDLWQASIIPIVDFNGDGQVDGKDVLHMASCWGTSDPLCDVGPFPWGDGIVDVQDLKALAEYIGKDTEDPTLLAHWSFDEKEGMVAPDSAATNDGTLAGNPAWQPAGGKVGGALQFDGKDDSVTTGSVLDPAQGPFSVFAWVKGGAPGQVILSQAGGANWLRAATPDGVLATELNEGGRNASKDLVSTAPLTDGAWHRVGLVWDGKNRILYVDGVEVAKDSLLNLRSSATRLHIGADSTLAPGTFWSGLIDDVRIYNRPVTP